MTTSVLSIAISGITPADQGAMAEAARRWDSIAKPIGGLGLLEEAVIRAAGVQGTADVSLDRKALAVFCADNGVTEEGVTQTGPEVTASVAASMAWYFFTLVLLNSCRISSIRVAAALSIPCASRPCTVSLRRLSTA